MKNSRWLGGLLLALATQTPYLLAQDVQWRAVEEAPAAAPDGPRVTLGRPVAVKEEPAVAAARHTADVILPVSFEALEPAPSRPEPLRSAPLLTPAPVRSSGPPPEIIAVSVPLKAPPPPSLTAPPDPDEDAGGNLFAIDRTLSPVARRASPAGPIVQTSAIGTTWSPGVANPWNMPPPDVPMLDGPDPDDIPAVNPLKHRFYTSAEYLLWWIKGERLPILATTSSPADAGILGAPTTSVLFGGSSINSGPYSGGRFTAGYWLDMWGQEAIEVSGFFLGGQATNFSATSSANLPVIARPFFKLNSNMESAQLTATPGVTSGTLTVNAPSNLWGAEANFRYCCCSGCWYRVTFLGGFRNLNLNESLLITENVQGLPTAPAPFTNEMITVFDRFATQNHFYGGQLGAAAWAFWGRWVLDVQGKLALGGTEQQLDINGGQRFVDPNGTITNFQGGLLAAPGNIGHFTHRVFSVVPELTLSLGYQLTPHLRGFLGYNFIYWSNVIRPGDQIDGNLDVTRVPHLAVAGDQPVPGVHPTAVFHESDLWIQGLTVGLLFTY